MTPVTSLNLASTPQKHPAPNVAFSIATATPFAAYCTLVLVAGGLCGSAVTILIGCSSVVLCHQRKMNSGSILFARIVVCQEIHTELLWDINRMFQNA
jgi:hypothetical protein